MNHNIIKITKTEIEFDNGDCFQFPIPLDYEPTIEQFQTLLNKTEITITDILHGKVTDN